MKKAIDECIKSIPEIYQQIWGHKEYGNYSRSCEQRAARIIEAVRVLQEKLGRKKLRVLDIGCAQGYFSFALQYIGCELVGLDFCKENIELCEALKEENRVDCKFVHGKLTKEFVDSLDIGQYDVILCLSVIHHVCNEKTFDYARSLMEELAKKSELVIAELALKSEPVYWNQSLPEQWEDWFCDIAFFDEIGFFSTHLSEVQRPLVLSSNRWFYCDKKFFQFEEWKKKSYELKSDDDRRRYYIGEAVLAKKCRDFSEAIDEICNEVAFLKKYPDLSFVPTVLAYEKKEKRVYAVYKIKKGKLLVEALKDGDNLEYRTIFYDILEQCVELEKHGLYHGDMRIWNICINEGRAFLIDFGNIQFSSIDSVARMFNPTFDYSVYDAFMALVYDVLTKKKHDFIKDYGIYNLATFYDFSQLEPKYASFFKSYLLLPSEKQNFQKMLELYEKTVINEAGLDESIINDVDFLYSLMKRGLCEKADSVELKAIKISQQNQKNEILAHINEISELQKKLSEQRNMISEQENVINELQERLSEQRVLIDAQDCELGELRGLIMNTRHRTVFGAFEWLMAKIVRK